MEGVDDRLLDPCQVNSVLHYYGFKEQEIPRIYTVLLCFTLHVMNLKYMKVSLFEISYKKKITFSPYCNFLRCTCIYGLQLISNTDSECYLHMKILLITVND